MVMPFLGSEVYELISAIVGDGFLYDGLWDRSSYAPKVFTPMEIDIRGPRISDSKKRSIITDAIDMGLVERVSWGKYRVMEYGLDWFGEENKKHVKVAEAARRRIDL
jgi:hypothetical protein